MDGRWRCYNKMLGELGKFKEGNWSLRSWLMGRFGFIGPFGKVGRVVWNLNGRMDGSVRILGHS